VIARSTMTWFSGRKEVKAQDAYYEVEAKYAKLKEGFDRAKYKAAMPQMAPKDEKSDDKAATGDLAKDYGSIVGDLEKVARDFAGTSAGAQAAILASDTFMTYQQPDKAAEIAQVATKAMDDRSMLAGLARMQLGAALATKGDCKEAVKVWGEVIANKSAAFLQGDASLRSGICFEALNEPQKAMEMYQKVSAEGPESSSATTAKGLLRALELKTKATAAPAKQG
jgi:TolA-binding protein